jgi:predicted DNA-binding transcriptional regulator AlpA
MGTVAAIGERGTALRSSRSLREELATLEPAALGEALEELQDGLVFGTRRLAAMAADAQRAARDAVEELIDIREVARLTQRSRSWIEHHPHAIPGRRQAHARGKLRWLKREVLRWLRTGG